jgi:hypothetical protein
MGMDLVPVNPSAEMPNDDDYGNGLHYNWAGWRWITTFLEEKGVDLSEFSGFNDGEIISEDTCKIVADTLEEHLKGFDAETRNWIEPHILRWRTCGGYEQW